MNSTKAVLRRSSSLVVVLLVSFLLSEHSLLAQPKLNFNRISVNWPDISLFVSVKCLDSLRVDLTKDNFIIKENGIQIDDFTITCPDPFRHCCVSIGLLIDRSNSMAPPNGGLNGAKAGAKAFVGMMEPCDEATLISFGYTVTVDVSMTHDTVALKNGINALSTGGPFGTKLWDAVIVGAQELTAKATGECKAIVVLTDGNDVGSTHTLNQAIAAAIGAKLRVFTIGLGTGIDEASLKRLADETGGLYFKAPKPDDLVAIYQQISTFISGGFFECEIKYKAKCMDGSMRDVELLLQKVAPCVGTDVKTKSYRAPKDTSTYKPIVIRLGQETVRGGQTANVPLLLETPLSADLDGPFQPATFTILFDGNCCTFTGITTTGFLLEGVGVDITTIPGGVQLTTLKSKLIDGAGILATLQFKASDPEQDIECPLKLFEWIFTAGCLRPVLIDGKLIIQARRPDLVCDLDMPRELLFDHGAKDYAPNPFPVMLTVTNNGDREARNGVATVTYDNTQLKLISPLSPSQPMNPKNTIENGGVSTVRWDFSALRRLTGDSVEVCITVTYDNAPSVTCCKKVWIPPVGPIVKCKLSAPAIKTNATQDRYIPMPFNLTVDVWNDGGMTTDSLFATIYLTPDLRLGASENGRAIKKVAPVRLAPSQHGTVVWELDHPISIDRKDYTVIVVIRQRDIDSTSCELQIPIPPLLAPVIDCSIQAVDSLVYDSTIAAFKPNPFPVAIRVKNIGGLEADSVRATIILPPDLELNPTTQPLTRYFNPMRLVVWNPNIPPNELSWTIEATKKPKIKKCYKIKFKIEGTSNTGPLLPTYCEKEVCVPPVAAALACDLYAPDSLILNPNKTGIVPNPFPVRFVVRNIGHQSMGVKEAQLLIENASGVFVQGAYPNPVTWNKDLAPKDTIDANWKLQVVNSRSPRVVRVRVIAWDEDGDPIECFKEIPIAWLNVSLVCSASGPVTIDYDQTTDTHSPNPFIGRFDIFNSGGDVIRNVEVEVKNLPPDVALNTGEPAVKYLSALLPSQTGQLQWSFVLTDTGKSNTSGKTVRIGVSYKADGIPLLENDCYFDVYIAPVTRAQLECSLSGPDTLRFVSDHYEPNPFDVKLTVWNRAKAAASNVNAYLLQDAQFNIVPPANRYLTPSLAAKDSVITSFELKVNPRQTSGRDTIRVAVTAAGTTPAYCEWPVYIFRELRPKFTLSCRAMPDTLSFSEVANDYAPNPFNVTTVAKNIGDNFAQKCQIVLLGKSGFTAANGSPVRFIGRMDVNRSDTIVWQIRALPRSIAGVDTLIFQVQGSGGIGNQIIVAECRIPVYVPIARKSEYTLGCKSIPDKLTFAAGQYLPNPFTVSVKVKNTGSAAGQQVAVRIMPPSFIELAPGEQAAKILPGIAAGDSAVITWLLSARARATSDTVGITIDVSDRFGVSSQCVTRLFVPEASDALLSLQCTAPDTLRIDQLLGEYIGNPFATSITIQNQGKARADSVIVRICLGCDDPTMRDLQLVNPTQRDILVAPSLDPFARVTQEWRILALPRTKSGLVQIKFTVMAKGLASSECIVYVYIGALGTPTLACMNSSATPDTLHFDYAAGDYEGKRSTSGGTVHTYFEVKYDVKNDGASQCRDVRAMLLLPAGVSLEAGETSMKDVSPSTLGSGQSGTVSWKCRPQRMPDGALRRFAVQLFSGNMPLQSCFADVFIVGAPKLSVLSIPRDNVGMYKNKVVVPVHIDETVGRDVASYRFTLQFDPRIVRFAGLLSMGTLTGSGWTGAHATLAGASGNLLKVQDYTTTSPLSKGSGPLVYLIFEGVFGGGANRLSIDSTELSFIDWSLNNGEIITQTRDGLVTISGECIMPMEATPRYSLKQNRPNPFNPTTEIEYTLPEDTYVTLYVMDQLGRTVQKLVEGYTSKGTYLTTFRAGDLPSGIYYYKIESPHYSKIMRMTLLR